ncbi:MAG: phosphatase PAP2 family protein [Duncaniella sp.]|nr:phosphatase PAP2 family protein [Duncaniella sp.]
MLRLFIYILVTLLCVGTASASRPGEADSVAVTAGNWRAIVAPASGVVISAVARQAYPHDFSVVKEPVKSDRGMDYVRFLPALTPWVLKAAGQPTRSSWGRMAVSQGLGAAIMLGTVEGLKHTVDSRRPDGSDTRSFPSGHAAVAYMGADMVTRELGWRSGWYAMGAYAVASAVAVERVVDGHHFPTDVVAGAALGVLSTELGYWLGDRIFGSRGLDVKPASLTDNTNFSFFSLSTGLSLPFGTIGCGDNRIIRLPALAVTARGGLAIGDSWGVAVEGGVVSTPIVVKSGLERTYVRNLSAITAGVGPYYTLLLGKRYSLVAEATFGYRFNLGINAVDDALTSESGTLTGRLGVGGSMRLTPRLRGYASAGIELSHYGFNLKQSDFYSIKTPGSASGLTSSLLLNLSVTYEL